MFWTCLLSSFDLTISFNNSDENITKFLQCSFLSGECISNPFVNTLQQVTPCCFLNLSTNSFATAFAITSFSNLFPFPNSEPITSWLPVTVPQAQPDDIPPENAVADAKRSSEHQPKS